MKTKNIEKKTNLERFNIPHDRVLLRRVFDISDVCFEFRRVRILGYRDYNFYVVGGRSFLELTFRFDHVLDSRVGVFLDNRFDPYERFHVRV